MSLVYSTGRGRIYPDCGQPVDACRCGSKRPVVPGDGIVRISRETRGRKGKGVTLITGLPLNDIELKLLAKELKIQCGSGGTVKDGTIEIQGDQREQLGQILKERGWTVKQVGG